MPTYPRRQSELTPSNPADWVDYDAIAEHVRAGETDPTVDNSLKGITKTDVQNHAPKEHGNEAHNPDFSEVGHIHTLTVHGNESHSQTFISTETDPTVDNSLKGVTKTQVQTHTPANHGNEAHSSTFVTVNAIAIDSNLSTNAQDAVSKRHDQTHTLTSHSTRAHSELTGIGADDHHAQAHTLASHSTKAHSELTNVGENDHHTKFTTVEHDTTSRHGLGTVVPHDALGSLSEKSHTSLTDIGTNTHTEIDAHIAAGGGGLGYTLKVQALTSSPADSATVYFGMLPKAPVTTANISKVYIRRAGTIKIAEIYCYSGTAGTAEAWSLYIRVNNTTDYLIATLSVSASERAFSNTNLSIAVSVDDYIEIKGIQPAWGTNPLTTIYGGYVYIE